MNQQTYKCTCYTRCISHMSTIMQQQYFSLRNQNQDFDIRLAKLWAEAKDIYAQLSTHELRRNELQNRLYDSNQSLTGPAVSEIASGPNNGSLRRIVVLMILERSKVQMNLEKRSINCLQFYNKVQNRAKRSRKFVSRGRYH